MSFLKPWPKCAHSDIDWQSVHECLPAVGTRYEYQPGQCRACGRPVVIFYHRGIAPSERRATRRHLAWWLLGKEWEHGGNVAVLDRRN